MQQALSPFQLQVYKCPCVIKFHVARLMKTLMKIASNSRSMQSLQSWGLSSFIVSEDIVSIFVDQNFYYECDWNGVRIIVIVQQTIIIYNNNTCININMIKILPVLLLASSLP